jgi:transposase-like protein
MEITHCPKCGSKNYVKHGIVKNRQRYTCKNCKYNFTVLKLGKMLEKFYIVRALQLYLEGVGFRGIERIIGVSNVTVMNWVKKYGKPLDNLKLEIPKDAIVEIDELCSCVETKKNEYGHGLLLLGGLNKSWLLKSEIEVR